MAASLCVYCGSNVGSSPEYLLAARELGAALASRGIGLVYGGGHVGLMGAVADAVLAAGGHVTGVITERLVAAEVAHRGLTVLEVVADMHERKARFEQLSDGFIALPGGFGTVEEVVEVLTWNQLGLIRKLVVFFDVGQYWAPLFDWMDASVSAGFVRQQHRMLARQARTADEAIDLALTPVPELPRKWMNRADRPSPVAPQP